MGEEKMFEDSSMKNIKNPRLLCNFLVLICVSKANGSSVLQNIKIFILFVYCKLIRIVCYK